ncbi:MAG: Wzz/FepE/Etk N-terminal domain-containing protein [Clostridiales bacterium]|nr:Wzz/FepE/Etk N-terminal domain-containing protein [Clostridiales bacterium]
MEHNINNRNRGGVVDAVKPDSDNAVEMQISIIDIINLAITFWWLIAIMAIVIGGATYAYTKLTAIPQYESTSTLYINTEKESKSDDVNATALKNTQVLLPTYIEVFKSTPFLEAVSDDIDNKYSASTISSMTEFTAIEETNLIDIKVTCADSHDAYLISKGIIKNAPEWILKVFEGGSVKTIEYPTESNNSIDDNSFKRGVIGFVAGAALAVLIIFLINLFDTRVKGADELTAKYNLPVLGEIPNLVEM